MTSRCWTGTCLGARRQGLPHAGGRAVAEPDPDADCSQDRQVKGDGLGLGADDSLPKPFDFPTDGPRSPATRAGRCRCQLRARESRPWRLHATVGRRGCVWAQSRSCRPGGAKPAEHVGSRAGNPAPNAQICTAAGLIGIESTSAQIGGSARFARLEASQRSVMGGLIVSEAPSELTHGDGGAIGAACVVPGGHAASIRIWRQGLSTIYGTAVFRAAVGGRAGRSVGRFRVCVRLRRIRPPRRAAGPLR
jgi:hypothetical protein